MTASITSFGSSSRARSGSRGLLGAVAESRANRGARTRAPGVLGAPPPFGEGRYLCSERTMYRLLAAHAEVRERRDQLRHPSMPPRSCWPAGPTSCGVGISPKRLGPAKWTYFYLYVMLDVFSRYVVGWMVAHRESATIGRAVHSGDLRRPGHRLRAAHGPRRPGPAHDVQARSPSCSPISA
jgi:transposase InsO family protein